MSSVLFVFFFFGTCQRYMYQQAPRWMFGKVYRATFFEGQKNLEKKPGVNANRTHSKLKWLW